MNRYSPKQCVLKNYSFTGFIKTTPQGSIPFVRIETVSRSKRQFENHCVFPDHPANGEMKILEEERPYFPNSNVAPNTIIDLSCTNGTVMATGGLSRAICYQGKWKPTLSQLGGCIKRTCPPVKSEDRHKKSVCNLYA